MRLIIIYYQIKSLGTPTVASSIFFSSNQRLGMKQSSVSPRPDLIDDIRFEIDIKGTRDVFSASRLREESRETAIVLRWGALDDTAIRLRKNQTF